MANTTEVLTTIRLTGNPEWSAMDMNGKLGIANAILVQSDDANVGIMGTRKQLADMCCRIEAALQEMP